MDGGKKAPRRASGNEKTVHQPQRGAAPHFPNITRAASCSAEKLNTRPGEGPISRNFPSKMAPRPREFALPPPCAQPWLWRLAPPLLLNSHQLLDFLLQRTCFFHQAGDLLLQFLPLSGGDPVDDFFQYCQSVNQVILSRHDNDFAEDSR